MTMKSTLKAILGGAVIAILAAGCIDDPVQVGRIENRAGGYKVSQRPSSCQHTPQRHVPVDITPSTRSSVCT